jgi:hypothetical protein
MNLSLHERMIELHGDVPWGSVLDAGLDSRSMR